MTIKPHVRLQLIQFIMIEQIFGTRFFFSIKKKLDKKIIEIPRVKSEDQLADVLTKTVMNMIFVRFVGKLGMFDIYMMH